jgi:predicted DNA-binding transcriptional regulator YafY
MSRPERLLALLEVLRLHRYPVSGAVLASRLGVSARTVYRDIAALQGLGARVVGEAGVGYVLQPGFTLPPIAFTDDELEALMLGARWAADRGDVGLADAARHAVAKIGAVLPSDRRSVLDDAPLLLNPGGNCGRASRRGRSAASSHDTSGAAAPPVDLTEIRSAIRRERKLVLTYEDLGDATTTRTVWPIALVFFAEVQVLVAWCELRAGFRHFRPDRIRAIAYTTDRYARRRHVLLAEWRAVEGLGANAGDPLQRRSRSVIENTADRI